MKARARQSESLSSGGLALGGARSRAIESEIEEELCLELKIKQDPKI